MKSSQIIEELFDSTPEDNFLMWQIGNNLNRFRFAAPYRAVISIIFMEVQNLPWNSIKITYFLASVS